MPKSPSVPPTPPENTPPEPFAREPSTPVPSTPEPPAASLPPAQPVPPAQPSPPGRFRAGAIPFLLGAAAVVVVIVLAGGTSWVVARAVAAEPVPAPTASATAAPKAGGGMQGMAKGVAVRGTVRSIADGSWTVETKAGPTVTVKVGGDVRFVKDGVPATAGDFAVGDAVVIAGTRSGTTIDAQRIAIPKADDAAPTT